MIIEQYTDMAGFIRILWQSQATLNIYAYKFQQAPTQAQLEELSEASEAESELQKQGTVDLSILAERQTIIAFIEKVKATPNVTLSQYNTYLGALPWYEAAVIRFFVYMIAQRLAERKNLTLANMNENTVLSAVRDFIVEQPIRRLARLIFNTNE